MVTPKSRSLNTLLSAGDTQLALLTAEAQRRLRLCNQVRRRLPAALAPHCFGAALEAGTLIVYMDSAAAATPVRYQQGELLTRLVADGLPCTRIKVQVLPNAPPAPTLKPSAQALPDAVCTMLETTAAGMAEGSLRHSLRNLARNRHKRR